MDELNLIDSTVTPSTASQASNSIENSEQAAQGGEQEIHFDLADIARSIPDKMAFKIGEVAEIAGLKTYVLRYWESEFDALSPQKSAFNQRVYTKRDVETVLLIKKLLYEERFSIAGAKRKIRELRSQLKQEKQLLESNDKVSKAVMKIEELVFEIGQLKEIFS